MDVLGSPLDAVLNDRDLEVDRGLIGEVAEPGFHRGEGRFRADGFLHERGANEDGRFRGRVDDPARVAAATDADVDRALGLLDVEPDDPALGRVLADAGLVDDPLHPRVRIVLRREEVVETGEMVVDDGALSEEGINDFAHGLRTSGGGHDHPVGDRDAGRLAGPADADEPSDEHVPGVTLGDELGVGLESWVGD